MSVVARGLCLSSLATFSMPCILYVDEIKSLLGKRYDPVVHMHSESLTLSDYLCARECPLSVNV